MKRSILVITFLLLAGILGYYFWPEKKLDTSKEIDKILVIKHKRRLIVFSKGEKLKTYKIALSKNPKGKKRFEGDMKTPEGIYFINDKNPNSGYHKNLGISYPNNSDIEYSRKHNQSHGGLIKIHGLKNGYGFIGKFHRITNWTLGCIAMTNKEVDELYENVAIGTEIEIVE